MPWADIKMIGTPGHWRVIWGIRSKPSSPGHAQIAEDCIDGRALEQLEGGLAVGRRADAVALGSEQQREALAQGVVVVHDQDVLEHRLSFPAVASSGSRVVAVRFRLRRRSAESDRPLALPP